VTTTKRRIDSDGDTVLTTAVRESVHRVQADVKAEVAARMRLNVLSVDPHVSLLENAFEMKPGAATRSVALGHLKLFAVPGTYVS
jgi:hypothetical protein